MGKNSKFMKFYKKQTLTRICPVYLSRSHIKQPVYMSKNKVFFRDPAFFHSIGCWIKAGPPKPRLLLWKCKQGRRQKNFQGKRANGNKTENGKKRPKNSTIKHLPERGAMEKRSKNSKKGRKIALISLYMLWPPLPTPMSVNRPMFNFIYVWKRSLKHLNLIWM